MKEIESKKYYLEEFDILVNQYLSLSQICQIANAVMKFDTWQERKQNLVMLLIYHATNLSSEEIEKIGVDNIMSSGLYDAVRQNVLNFEEVQQSLSYSESLLNNLSLVLKKSSPQLLDLLKVVGNKYGKNFIEK